MFCLISLAASTDRDFEHIVSYFTKKVFKIALQEGVGNISDAKQIDFDRNLRRQSDSAELFKEEVYYEKFILLLYTIIVPEDLLGFKLLKYEKQLTDIEYNRNKRDNQYCMNDCPFYKSIVMDEEICDGRARFCKNGGPQVKVFYPVSSCLQNSQFQV